MLLDALVDHAGDAQRLRAGAAIDQRLLAGRDAVEERVNLVGKTVLFLNLVRLGADRRKSFGHRIAAQPIAEDLPFAEIAVEVLMTGKDTHAPFGLVAHAARRDVGDASRFEGDAGIGEIDAPAEDRRADGVDRGRPATGRGP